ncbi:hypothetical protein AJ88_00875 [Mesorhizobium amorphae CCBAU 01583]|nr:hypothetical protein AJ88_00875 [Mesorhizobium amorphae CCBAU 01583]
MTRVAGRVEPGSLGTLLDDDADGLTRQALFGDMAVAVHAPEDRSRFDLRMVQPVDHVLDRAPARASEWYADLSALAFLIDLRSTQGDDHALSDIFDVGHIEANEFGTPKCAREAEQQERLVASVLRSVCHALQYLKQVLPQDRLRFAMGMPRVRLMPRSVDFTISDFVGFGAPFASWIFDSAVIRRMMVATL